MSSSEGRLSMEIGEGTLMAIEGKDQNQAKKKGKGKKPPQGGIKKESKCFFCKKKGHMKKGCTKFQKWLEKKGKPISFICYESNMVDVIYTHGGLILVLQSIFRIPCKVSKT